MQKSLMITMVVILTMLAGFLWYREASAPESPSEVAEPIPEVIVGGDRDEHGCIGSAGYSWCEPRNECIRPWETYCTATPGKTVTFMCKKGKSIEATFYIGDDKFVDLVLSDGRVMSVPHAISASGARYAKEDESFVFWNKGDTAFITEANGEETYSECVLK